MITAEIIADSVTPAGNRLTTFVLTYPRFIHSEFMTHRCFSRNASSSRAIPIEKMIRAIQDQPALFEYWGKNQAGMQALEMLDNVSEEAARNLWLDVCDENIISAFEMIKIGAHKQIVNRLLEPWAHITVIATASEQGLRNFFGLRAHPDAQPEFQVLAYRMLKLWLSNKPITLDWGQWHIPYEPDLPELQSLSPFGDVYIPIKIATGRIARVSYLTHEGKRDVFKDIELHDRLLKSGHMSPFEHCAQAILDIGHPESNATYGLMSNFGDCWLQYRKTLDNECQAPTDKDLEERLAEKPEWITL